MPRKTVLQGCVKCEEAAQVGVYAAYYVLTEC